MPEEPTGLYNYLPRLDSRRTTRKSRKSRVRIGPLKQGLLTKVGYSVGSKVTARHRAVKLAVKKYGRTSTIRKLNAVAVYTRRSAPAKSKKFKADMKFAQKMKGGDKRLALENLKSDVSKVLNDHGDHYTNIAKLRMRAAKLGVNVHEVKTIDDLYGKLKDAGVGRF